MYTKEELIEKLEEGYTLHSGVFDSFRNDKEIVLFAVKINGWNLEYASDEMKNDKEVVWEAVRQNIEQLEFAGTRLKDDEKSCCNFYI